MPKNSPEFRELGTEEVCSLLTELQAKGAKIADHYKKYGALCYGVPEEEFVKLPLKVTMVAFEHITETLKAFN
jgi:hypothetical protein